MSQYRVLKGRHKQGGIAYGRHEKAGAIVESDRDLVALFRNKFELVAFPAPSSDQVTDTPRSDVSRTALDDLLSPEIPVECEAVTGSDGPRKTASPLPSGLGKEITDDHKSVCSDLKVRLFRKGRKYSILDVESSEVLKTASSKIGVQEALSELMEEEPDLEA